MSAASAQGHAPLSYSDALHRVVDGSAPLADEVVPLGAACGRALAAPVSAGIDLPPWDNAGMDGYAVRREDVLGATAAAPVRLTVTRTVAAGDGVPSERVTPGFCMRIMTGAAMPAGADCVIRIEDTDGGDAVVHVRAARDAEGRGNVRPRGEDVRAGELLFGPGTTISPTHLGVMASIGLGEVRVHRRPRVSIVSSGDELAMLEEFGQLAREGNRRIVSSTSYALPALLELAGAAVVVRPLVRDTLDAMTMALRDALDDGCDLLVTTGGVSVGAHDHTRAALRAIGGTLEFWRAAIRPGGPMGIGTVRGVRWLGLPGNPVSTMVTGTLFAWPLVRRLAGHARVHHLPVRVRMLDDVELRAPLTHFLRVVLTPASDGFLDARLAGPQGSNLLQVLSAADALLVVPADVDTVTAGDMFDAIVLPERGLVSDVSLHTGSST